jgi:hypothetical protein
VETNRINPKEEVLFAQRAKSTLIDIYIRAEVTDDSRPTLHEIRETILKARMAEDVRLTAVGYRYPGGKILPFSEIPSGYVLITQKAFPENEYFLVPEKVTSPENILSAEKLPEGMMRWQNGEWKVYHR